MLELPNWMNEMPFYHWLAVGGGAVVVVALLLYFTPVKRLKIPGVIGGTLGGLAVGTAVGVLGMTYFGYKLPPSDGVAENPTAPQGSGQAGGPPRPQGPPGMGGMMGGMGGMMGGMGGQRGPNSKAQLTRLVAKIDDLTQKPLELKLSDDQKKKVREQLKDLDAKEDLSEDEAKAKLDNLKKALEDQKDTLESAGYNWSGGQQGGGGRPRGDAPKNPFKEGKDGTHLKALRDRMGPG